MTAFMRCAAAALLSAPALLGTSAAQAADVVRHGFAGSDFPIAMAVEVPAGKRTVYLSGFGPAVADAKAPPGSIAAFGDTKAQTLSTLAAIEASLKQLKLEMKDVVRMTVFLVGDPAKGGRMDFAGMMEAYRQYYGAPKQPQLPARSTVQVAALANPGWLVEIEVTAVAPD